jgi:hypothetical protein
MYRRNRHGKEVVELDGPQTLRLAWARGGVRLIEPAAAIE